MSYVIVYVNGGPLKRGANAPPHPPPTPKETLLGCQSGSKNKCTVSLCSQGFIQKRLEMRLHHMHYIVSLVSLVDRNVNSIQALPGTVNMLRS